jgi:hypothetical protein
MFRGDWTIGRKKNAGILEVGMVIVMDAGAGC